MNFPTMEMDSMRLGTIAAAGALLIATAGTARAQRAVTRADVVAVALARGPRIVFARADSTAAHAGLSIASQFENPIFGLSYSKSVPQQHFSIDVPLDYPWLRKARVGAAVESALANTIRGPRASAAATTSARVTARCARAAPAVAISSAPAAAIVPSLMLSISMVGKFIQTAAPR